MGRGETPADRFAAVFGPGRRGQAPRPPLDPAARERPSEPVRVGLQVLVIVEDSEKLERFARAQYETFWGEGDWEPAGENELIYEALVASNNMPSPDTIGLEIDSSFDCCKLEAGNRYLLEPEFVVQEAEDLYEHADLMRQSAGAGISPDLDTAVADAVINFNGNPPPAECGLRIVSCVARRLG